MWEYELDLAGLEPAPSPEPAPQREPEPVRPRRGRRWFVLGRELVETLLLALLIFLAVRSAVQNFSDIEDCVILPSVEIGNNVTLRRAIVDKHCRLPDGLTAGVDPKADRKRFHVTERGVTVIVPESLGQRYHHLR